MLLAPLFAALAAWATLGVQAGLPSREDAAAKIASETNRYIVEFDNTANLQQAGLKRRIVDNTASLSELVHERMYADLRARGVGFSVFQEYTADIFIGASITVDSDADLASLASAAGVLNIIPVRLVPMPDLPTGIDTDFVRASPQSSPQPQLVSNATQAIFQAPNTGVKTGFSNLPQFGADRVQATGNLGRGIKIGIIDTGVDYTREPLGGCFGPNCKIVGGYDFAGDNYNGQNQPVEDADPLDKCSGHGTIVAGLIGANNNEFGVPGVAPEASLYAYRTYGCTGTSGEDVIFKAMQRAYVDGVDVLNLSLGEISSWTSSALSVMAARLVQAGMTVVASAGNQNIPGPFLGSAPSTGTGVIGAGALNTTVFPAHNLTTPGRDPITMYNYRAIPDGEYPIVTYPGDPYGCNPPNVFLGGAILVVRKGGPCDYVTKARAAFNLSGDYILYAQDTDEEPFYYDFRTINGADVGKADGDWLFANAGKANLTAGFRPAPRNNTISGGRATYLSNIGPTNDLFLNTDILAPGSNVIGILPDNPARLLTNWSITDGTSWSSAFVAGSAALYLTGKRDASPDDIQTVVQNTGAPITTANNDATILGVAQQGAGLLNIAAAINTGTTIEPSQLLLNDTQYFQARQIITVTNNGRTDRNYRVRNVAAGTQIALDPSSNYTNNFPVPQVNNGAQVRASSGDSSFRLRPGRSRRVELTFTAPTGLDPKTLPVYSGFIEVKNEAETLNVPYLGVARRMKENPIFDSTDRYFGPGFKLPLAVNYDTLGPSEPGTVYNFQGFNYPSLYYRFVGGSRVVYIDLVAGNTTIPTTYTKRAMDGEVERSYVEERDFTPVHMHRRWFWDGWFGNGNNAGNGNGNGNNGLSKFDKLLCKLTGNFLPICRSDKGGSFARVPIVGNLRTQTFVTRDRVIPGDPNYYQLYLFETPQLRNGTAVPNGSYKFLMRALKITGDPTKNEDYESYLSPAFTVQV